MDILHILLILWEILCVAALIAYIIDLCGRIKERRRALKDDPKALAPLYPYGAACPQPATPSPDGATPTPISPVVQRGSKPKVCPQCANES